MVKGQELALAYLTQAQKYLSVAQNIFEQMVSSGNLHIVSSNGNQASIWKDYHEKTKWSDFHVMFPALFLFYHGVELTLKGLFPLFNKKIPFGHKSSLLDNLRKLDNKNPIVEVAAKYFDLKMVEQTPLGNWLKENEFDIDGLYEGLRYPTSRGHNKLLNNLPLKYQEEKMIPFANQIIQDSKKLRELFIERYNNVFPAHF